MTHHFGHQPFPSVSHDPMDVLLSSLQLRIRVGSILKSYRLMMRICFGLNLVLDGTRLKIMVRRKSYLTRQQLRERFSNHRFLAYINEEMNIFCDTLQGLSP